jgi:hypothetical protein
MPVLVENAVVVLHLLAMAVGLGTVVSTDLTVLARLRRPLSQDDAAALHRAHRTILCALGGLWVSGLVLVAARTGFDPGAMSPKLWAKLATVTLLTLVAWTMSRWALPVVASAVGRPIASLPRRPRLLLGLCAGLSAGAWSLALVLGGATMLKAAAPATVALLGSLIFAGAIGIALAVVMHAGQAAVPRRG